jgi:hypothetical protein
MNNTNLFNFITEYNENMKIYNNNTNHFLRLLAMEQRERIPPPATTHTPTVPSTTARRTTQPIGELQQFINSQQRATPATSTTTPPLTGLPRVAVDNYLTRILELLNNAEQPIDNDLTISFSFMRETDEVPVYQMMDTVTSLNVSESVYQSNTAIITYNSEMNQERCPISHEAFEPGESITKICGCGHFFKTENIKRWFLRSPCCPTCRYNILIQGYETTQSAL